MISSMLLPDISTDEITRRIVIATAGLTSSSDQSEPQEPDDYLSLAKEVVAEQFVY